MSWALPSLPILPLPQHGAQLKVGIVQKPSSKAVDTHCFLILDTLPAHKAKIVREPRRTYLWSCGEAPLVSSVTDLALGVTWNDTGSYVLAHGVPCSSYRNIFNQQSHSGG